MDDIEARLSRLEDKLNRIGESGLTSPSFGKRLISILGYNVLIGLIWGAVYLFFAILIMFIGTLVNL